MRNAVIIMVLVLLRTTACAQPPSQLILQQDHSIHPPHTANNAAWAYFAAWDMMPDAAQRTMFYDLMVAPADAGTHGTDPATGRRLLDKDQRAALAAHRDMIDAVLAATDMPVCDWGAAYGDAFLAQLPHLSYIRQSWRMLRCDAFRCMEDHDPQGVARRVAACFRMADHISADRFLISNLVADSVARSAAGELEEWLPTFQLTPAAARTVLNAARALLTAPDFLHFQAAFEFEASMTTPWLRQIRGSGAAAWSRARLDPDTIAYRWISPAYYYQLDEHRFNTELDRADQFIAAVKSIWHKPDAMVALRELETESYEGQWGILTPVIFPYLRGFRYNSELTRTTLERVARKMQAIIAASESAGEITAAPEVRK